MSGDAAPEDRAAVRLHAAGRRHFDTQDGLICSAAAIGRMLSPAS
jgi:hypothetical protein